MKGLSIICSSILLPVLLLVVVVFHDLLTCTKAFAPSSSSVFGSYTYLSFSRWKQRRMTLTDDNANNGVLLQAEPTSSSSSSNSKGTADKGDENNPLNLFRWSESSDERLRDALGIQHEEHNNSDHETAAAVPETSASSSNANVQSNTTNSRRNTSDNDDNVTIVESVGPESKPVAAAADGEKQNKSSDDDEIITTKFDDDSTSTEINGEEAKLITKDDSNSETANQSNKNEICNEDDKKRLQSGIKRIGESISDSVAPVFGAKIEKGVPDSTIKAAAVSGALGALFIGSSLPLAGVFGLGAAFAAIAPGPVGEAARAGGKFAYKVSEVSKMVLNEFLPQPHQSSRKMVDTNAAAADVDYQQKNTVAQQVLDSEILVGETVMQEGLQEAAKIEKQEQQRKQRQRQPKKVQMKEVIPIAYDAAAKLAYERSDKLMDYPSFRAIYEANAISDVVTKRQARLMSDSSIAEEVRLAEETRIAEAEAAKLAEEARIMEEEAARLVEEARIMEEEAKFAEARIAEETRIAEEVRMAEEARMAKQALIMEEAKMAEEARIAEEAQIAEEARLAEEARIAEEARLAEEARIAEEARLAKENKSEDDGIFSEDDWETSIRLAQEGLDSRIVGVDDIGDGILDNSIKADWDAAGRLAKELDSQPPLEQTKGDDDLSALARAAREAVELYEADMQFQENNKKAMKEKWAQNMVPADEVDLEEIAAAARAAVEMFEADNAGEDAVDILVDTEEEFGVDEGNFFDIKKEEEETQASASRKDWSKCTVVKLREELTRRGLSTTGKKADLVASLEKSDLEIDLTGPYDVDFDNDKQDSFDFESGTSPTTTASVDVDDDMALMLGLVNGEERSSEEAIDLQDLAAAARAAVATFEADVAAANSGETATSSTSAAAALLDLDEEPSDEALRQLESGDFGFLDETETESEPEMATTEPENDIDDTDAGTLDYQGMTVMQLKEECRAKGLKVGGRKAQLIARLLTFGQQ